MSMFKRLQASIVQNEINLHKDLVHLLPAEIITQLPVIIQSYEISPLLYNEQPYIQMALALDPNFPCYLLKLSEHEANTTQLNSILKALHEGNLSFKLNPDITAYRFEAILYLAERLNKFHENKEKNQEIILSYLKVLTLMKTTTNEILGYVFDNVVKYCTASGEGPSIAEFTNKVLAYFELPFIHCFIQPAKEDIIALCSISENTHLIELFVKLYKKGVRHCFSFNALQRLLKETSLLQSLIHFTELVDYEYTNQLLSYWQQNGEKMDELRSFFEALKRTSQEQLKTALATRVSYINFIYGDKYKIVELLKGSRKSCEDLLIYAIINSKKRFLSLLEGNIEILTNISNRSILINEALYTQRIDIDELSLEDIKDLSLIYSNSGYGKYFVETLKPVKHTAKDIITLYKIYTGSHSGKYIQLFYAIMENQGENAADTVFELYREQLLPESPESFEDKDINTLGQLLGKHSLSFWLQKKFSHVRDITKENALRALTRYEEIKEYIKQAEDNGALSFVLRNFEAPLFQRGAKLADILEHNPLMDRDWLQLQNTLRLTADFIYQNEGAVLDFSRNSNPFYANIMMKNLYGSEEESCFKSIIMSVLSGNYYENRYRHEALSELIGIPLQNAVIIKWQDNLTLNYGQFSICERDSFQDILLSESRPRETSISYRTHRCEYLLPRFDGYTKIIHCYRNNHVFASAMLYLTKGVPGIDKKSYLPKHEAPILFLDRPSVDCNLSADELQDIMTGMIEFANSKAALLGCSLAVSKSHDDYLQSDQRFKKIPFSIYIPESAFGFYSSDFGGGINKFSTGQYFSSHIYLTV